MNLAIQISTHLLLPQFYIYSKCGNMRMWRCENEFSNLISTFPHLPHFHIISPPPQFLNPQFHNTRTIYSYSSPVLQQNKHDLPGLLFHKAYQA